MEATGSLDNSNQLNILIGKCQFETAARFRFVLQSCRVTRRWSACRSWRNDFRKPITCQRSWQTSGRSFSLWIAAEIGWRSAEQRPLWCATASSCLESKTPAALCKSRTLWAHLEFHLFTKLICSCSVSIYPSMFLFACFLMWLLFTRWFFAIMFWMLKVATLEMYCANTILNSHCGSNTQ